MQNENLVLVTETIPPHGREGLNAYNHNASWACSDIEDDDGTQEREIHADIKNLYVARSLREVMPHCSDTAVRSKAPQEALGRLQPTLRTPWR